MRLVIVGYGRVGIRTALILGAEGHDVTVVDIDPDKIERAERDGFSAINGDGGDEAVLKRAGIETADTIGAFTPDLNVNYAACMIGSEHGCRTVLRVNEDYREELYSKYAEEVDEIVYPERMGAAGAKTALLGGNFNLLGDLTEQLQISSITIPDASPVIGQSVRELDFDERARVYAHGRKKNPMTIPLPGTRIEAGDSVAIIAETEHLESVKRSLIGE